MLGPVDTKKKREEKQARQLATEIDESRMQIRPFTPGVFVRFAAALLVLSTAGTVHAQGAAELEVSEPAPARAEPVRTAEPAPQELDANLPTPGIESSVIVAGESEAADAFSAGDSVTGFDAADMEAIGAINVADIADFTPNLEIVTAGATTPTFFIRGVGLNDFNSNSSGAVAIFQDDVPMNSPALQLGTIFDAENVIVERGPVGYGAARNASAGAIRLYSRKPTGSTNGSLRTMFGNYGYNDFAGAVEAPVFEDVLLARLSFRTSYRDGFQRNGCSATRYPGQRTSQFAGPARSPRWSICGEDVKFRGESQGFNRPPASGFSPIPLGLPEYVNDLGNWATRLNLRYQPTLDQDWQFNMHVAQRDEYSRQGLSYGTLGPQTFADGSVVQGILGGQDSNGKFQRPEVLLMRDQLRRVFEVPLRARAPTVCPGDNPDAAQPTLCIRQLFSPAREAANIGVANQIAQQLDFDPYTGYYDKVGNTDNLTFGGYAKGVIALPNDLQFTTISAFDGYDRFTSSDTDQSPNRLFEIQTDDEGWQIYQNLEVVGPLAQWPIDWKAGGYYLQEQLDVVIANDFGDAPFTSAVTDRDYTQGTRSFGVYADFTWSFWDDFTFDGGARYNWDYKEIDYSLLQGDSRALARSVIDEQSRSAPTGGVRLTYNFREDTHVYWKYTRGWKGGHYNATSSLREGVSFAEPEENNAYETGVRGNWFDSKLSGGVQFFFYDYSNYQLFTVQNDFSSNPEFVVINASDVQNYGSEVELTARPWDNTRFETRFSWLENTFVDFTQRQVIRESTQIGVLTKEILLNFSGNRLLNSPQFKISFTGEQTVKLGRYGALTARYDGVWTDTNYFDPTEGRGLPNRQGQIFLPENTIAQRPYWLHNLNFVYRPPVGNVTLEAWVRNLTDERYKSFAFDATNFQNITVYFTGDPRMVGGAVTVNF